MIFSAVSCTTLLDSDAPKVLDSAATDTAVTLENLVIAEEYNEEDNINMSIGHKKSVFGNLEQDISYDESIGQDLFYNDTVVYDQNIYMMNSQFNNIEALVVNKSFIGNLTSGEDDVRFISQTQVPTWLLPDENFENESITQDYRGNAYLLRKMLPSNPQFSEYKNLSTQEIVQISLSENNMLNKSLIDSPYPPTTIKCGQVSNDVFLLASNLVKDPKSLLFSLNENSEEIKFYSLFMFDKDILSWDCMLDSLVVVLEDQTMHKYQLVVEKGQLSLSNPVLLASVPSMKDRVCVKYNPIKQCVYFQETTNSFKSWFYSERSSINEWVFVGENSYCVLSVFPTDSVGGDNFEEYPCLVLMKEPVLFKGPKAWIHSPCFLNLTNEDNDGYFRWMKIDYRHYMK